MSKKRFVKFVKGCKMVTLRRKGKSDYVTLKCPKYSKNKFQSAKELVDSA